MITRWSEEFFARSKAVAPGGVHSPVRAFKGVGGTPRFIASAEGAELIDVDGNRYIDFCMSWGPMLFGHRDPDVEEAVRSAMSRGWSYGACEPYSLDLAEFLTSRVKCAEKVRFVSSGTEAVMSALRVARAATGRSKIVKFDGCYHGHTDSMLVRSGSGLADMGIADSAGVTPGVAKDTLVVPLDDLAALRTMLDAHGKDVAAIIMEPVPANYGLLLQKAGFVKDVAALAHEFGALFIMDEVISGFRVAFGGAAEVFGVTPDLVTYGKVIGGGFPVGAYAGKAALMDLVAPQGPVYQAGTLSANPVAMAAGLAMLKKLDRDRPYMQLEAVGEAFGKELVARAAKATGLPAHGQQQGSILWLVLGEITTSDGEVRSIQQIPAGHKAAYAALFHKLLDRGVYLAPSGFEVSFLSTAHTEAHLSRVLDAVHS